MKRIIFLGAFLSFITTGFTQNDGVFLGKSNFLSKNIYEYRKTGFWRYRLGKLHFKVGETGDYQRIGFLAKRLRPYFENNASRNFGIRYCRKYRTKKGLAYVGDIGAGLFLYLWMSQTIENASNGVSSVSSVAFNRRNTFWYVLGYFGSAYGALGLRVTAENDLLTATLIQNGRIKQKISKPNLQLGTHLTPTTDGVVPSLSMQLQF